jgi:hypothetical protein
MKRRLRAPSPALVIALIALFVALGGTSYAAIKLPKNSVGSKQLKKNAVTGAKIKNGAVTKSKINTAGLTVPNATHASTADSATSATNATNATHATSADTATNATTVGGKKVQQFFADDPASTASTTIVSVDGVTLKGACSSAVDPTLTVENDSGQGAMLGGYSSSNGVGNLAVTNLTTSPFDLTNGTNGGGVFTVQLRTGVVVSVQFAATGTLGGTVTHCYISGSVVAS